MRQLLARTDATQDQCVRYESIASEKRNSSKQVQVQVALAPVLSPLHDQGRLTTRTSPSGKQENSHEAVRCSPGLCKLVSAHTSARAIIPVLQSRLTLTRSPAHRELLPPCSHVTNIDNTSVFKSFPSTM
jgi:hypothetical protein